MEKFQTALDALQKQSKEQITATIDALQTACEAGVSASRVAIFIGNRLTPGQIVTSFPIICLLDAMTARLHEAHIAAALEEFWVLAPSLFSNYADTDPALREKVSRIVRRWGGKKGIPTSLSEDILAAMAGKKVSGDSAESKNATEHRHISELTSSSGDNTFTSSEVSGFCAIIQNCIKMIERLPTHQANMYLDVVKNERKLQKPSKTAFLFLQGLHTELSRELSLGTVNLVNSGKKSVDSAVTADGVDNKAALGNLIDKLAKEQTTWTSTSKEHTFHVIRYSSPLQSDTCQRLSVAQRSGFGDWQRRVKNEYHYPKKESGIRRVVRAPAGAQAARAFRGWFPSEQQWISENDMSSLSLYHTKDTSGDRQTSSVYDVVRKRDRDT